MSLNSVWLKLVCLNIQELFIGLHLLLLLVSLHSTYLIVELSALSLSARFTLPLPSY